MEIFEIHVVEMFVIPNGRWRQGNCVWGAGLRSSV
jgi:hypothetical protein